MPNPPRCLAGGLGGANEPVLIAPRTLSSSPPDLAGVFFPLGLKSGLCTGAGAALGFNAPQSRAGGIAPFRFANDEGPPSCETADAEKLRHRCDRSAREHRLHTSIASREVVAVFGSSSTVACFGNIKSRDYRVCSNPELLCSLFVQFVVSRGSLYRR